MSDSHVIADTQSLLNVPNHGRMDTTRRTVLQAALGCGYAVAAREVMAQTAIKTSSQGLVTGEVIIDAMGFKMNAYRAAPQGKTHLPVVIVVQEIFGVHEYIADVCRRLAHLGYLAVAPELFQRQGDPSQYNNIADLQRELVSKVGDAQVMADLDATVVWAMQNGGQANRVGITGFCWGGRIAWLYAAHSTQLKAAVAWYGRLVGVSSASFPSHPIDRVDSLRAPVLGLYGRADAGIGMDSVSLMQNKLQNSKNKIAQACTFVTYEDTPHAFHADYRATYRQSPANDGWQRALAWFRQHGV